MGRIYEKIQYFNEVLPSGVRLIAVSKFHPVEKILEAYGAGQRRFAESRPQEFAAKVPLLPPDIEWHFIGHLQTNKLKLVLPYASLIHSVDSLHLLEAIDRWAASSGRQINVLLELHLGSEETKHGFSEEEILSVLAHDSFSNVNVKGLMGMATNTEDMDIVDREFTKIAALLRKVRSMRPELDDTFTELSIGMTDDWPVAVRHGATMIRIGTEIFGPREY